ncbi:MAG: polysaccharide biosynthesis tyrosine autokinase [Verrucomicrobiota bacterium JB022]|nr:polysaccharide biosynthesis tyrosine autokinase [Verrucomicrobiota bacterium JB022]
MVANDFDLFEDKAKGGSSSGPTDWQDQIRHYWQLAKLLLKRYWWLPLVMLVLGAGWRGWQAKNDQPTYRWAAKIMLSGFVAQQLNTGVQEQFSYWFGNQKAFLESSDVRKAARERVAAFHPDLEASGVGINPVQIPDTSIIQILASGQDRQYTQYYLDALLEEYINWRQQMKGETSERALLAITEQLDDVERRIQQAEDAVVEFRKQNNLIFIQEQGDSAGSNLAALERRRSELRTQMRLIQSLGLDMQLQNPQSMGLDRALISTAATESYQEAKRSLAQMKAERDQFARYLKPRHPKMIALADEINRTQELMEIYRQQAEQQVGERKEELQVQLDNLNIIISEQEGVALENSRLSAEFDRLQANLARFRSQHESLLRSLQTIESGQDISPEIVSVLERPIYMGETRMNFQRSLIEGAMLGFVLGALLVGGLGLIDNRVISAEDLRNRFDTPVLGLIPTESQRKDGRVEILQAADTRHLFAEACRTLRSSLFFMGTDEDRPEVILVTSSVPEEGKSTVAMNLAAAISLTASRVLLIDADLRRGQIAPTLQMPRAPGLAEVLQGQISLKDAVRTIGSESLHFLASGEYPQRPGELLLSRRMDEVLAEAREAYDYVVIDSAPILATDDTTSLAQRVDVALFVVRTNYSQVRQIKGSLERLRLRGTKIGGFVLNYVDVRGGDYYYYKKYNDYYAPPSSGAGA